jgi:cation:H+ antiporter
VAALVAGAFFTVLATENIVSGLGIEAVVGGLFITAPMAALPEVFATWSVARAGQVTPAVTSVVGDHAATLTLSFVPLALVGLPLDDLRLLAVNLAGVALVAALYAGFIGWGGAGFRRWQVVVLAAVAPLWAAVVYFWAL